MDLVDEMIKKGFIKEWSQPTVRCKLFEDNSAALTLANSPAMKPCTKHINVKYHFFESMLPLSKLPSYQWSLRRTSWIY
jgi:hypothetical protein